MSQPIVYISYGLAEGPLTGKKVRQALSEAGALVTKDLSAATHIFAHSGGCFVLPSDISAQHIMLIDIPYWPGKYTLSGILQKLMNDYRYRKEQKHLAIWWQHLARHILYGANVAHTAKLWLGRRNKAIWDLPVDRLTIIRNDEDTFFSSAAQLPFTKQPTILTAPGQHDDCWDNPTHYVELLLGAPRG